MSVKQQLVTVELYMLPDDVEALIEANKCDPIVAIFEHHTRPETVAFGEVSDVQRK